jgi:UDPglucose--hexose-1-phosphate uridylyltransferase
MQELRIDPLSGLRVAMGPADPPGSATPGEAATVADDPLAGGRGQPEMFARRPGAGTVETIDSVPGPALSLLELGPDGLAATMELWRTRLRAHGDAPCRHLVVDEGGAGAEEPSRARLHALPFVPAAIARERERFTAYHDRTQGRNLLEDLLTEEVRGGERLVVVDREAIVICPFASAVPLQLQLIPRRPAARFEDDGPLGAGALHGALARLAGLLGGSPPLSLWLRTAPSGAESFCWRIDVQPRLERPGGLELGSGLWRNEHAPERAAASLRDAGAAT